MSSLLRQPGVAQRVQQALELPDAGRVEGAHGGHANGVQAAEGRVLTQGADPLARLIHSAQAPRGNGAEVLSTPSVSMPLSLGRVTVPSTDIDRTEDSCCG